MNIDTKNFNKTLANQIEEHVKKSLMNKLNFFSEMQESFNIYKQVNVNPQ